MKSDGLWYAHFTAAGVQGDGMVVLRDGELLGGDPIHTYVGSYTTDGPQLYLNVRVSPYVGHGPTDIERPIDFVFSGTTDGDSGKVSGFSNNHRDLKAIVELHRAA